MVSKMYKEMYSRWLAANLDDPDLKPELESIQNDDAAIQDRFAVALKFGTAGLRGVIGAGTNRMNVYVVRQATQGLANWVKTQGGTQTVAISYDSRIKSDVFAKAAAEVLAANGVKVRIYSALMPVPALSFATRYYNCNAGIMVTASHNPAKYNGYKAYGPDGCQMTDEAADIVYAEIQKTDILTGAKTMPFAEGLEEGIIEYVGDDCITLKSGTEETPSPVPCENIVIANCLLVHGHGGIVIGSEMSGGVRNVTVTNCVFTGTDRGLRVKTRRRRGGCVENLRLSNLVMERVFCPFVFNMYYSCGTAEKDRWVWEKTPYPVDGGTPAFRNIRINGVTVVGATASAGFFYGLAESPIDGLSLTDCHIEMARGAAPEKPAMMGNLEPMSARGFFLRNAKNVEFHNVTLKNADGEAYDTDESVDGEF